MNPWPDRAGLILDQHDSPVGLEIEDLTDPDVADVLDGLDPYYSPRSSE